MQLIFFLILFVVLFFLSRTLTSTISLFFLKLTRSNNFSIQALAFLFLPGVIIHELSHWLIAEILFVPTGEIEFLPVVDGNDVKLGSVQIAKTDPFRRFFIGVAPLIIGLSVILLIFQFISPISPTLSYKSLLFAYVIFEIGNTMFSSKKDLDGVLAFIIFAFLFISLLFFLQIPVISAVKNLIEASVFQKLLSTLNFFFLLAIGIDVIIIGIFRSLVRVIQRR